MEKIFLKFDMVTKEYTIEKDKIDDYFCGVGYIKIKST